MPCINANLHLIQVLAVPVNLMNWGAAILPIACLLILMVACKWPAGRAATASLIVTLISSVLLFKAPATLLMSESLKGAWSAFSVLLVILPAIMVYEVSAEAGAFEVFRKGMQSFSQNELLQILAMGWVFVSFLQGITGFGVPVAVGAPLLVGMGLRPVYAVVIPLIAHAWANTYGTLGLAWDALVETSGLSVGSAEWVAAAFWLSIFVWIFNMLAGLLICYLYGRLPAVKKGFVAVAVIAFVHGFGQLILSYRNPTIAAFIPSTLAMLVVYGLGRLPGYRQSWSIEHSPMMREGRHQIETTEHHSKMKLVEAAFPYIVLVVLTFIALLISPINRFLSQFQIAFAFPETRTGFGVVNPAVSRYSPLAPLVHAGLFLLLSAIGGYLYFRRKGYISDTKMRKICQRVIKKASPSILSVFLLLILSKLMSGTGQTEVLAAGTAAVLGPLYIVLVPFVGVLGSFISGSNMASNILFGQFQMNTAGLLNLAVGPVIGAQSAGGAIGSTICTSKVVLATATTGISGEEGAVLKKTLPISFLSAIFIGLILLAVQYWL